MFSQTCIDRCVAALAAIRARRPMVHNITNYVVMNSTANALLALGASPVMAHAAEEVEELAAVAGALVLNIGTLSPAWVAAMFKAARAARAAGVPVIFDPVGSGATTYRTATSLRILAELKPDVVRGNASEILSLGGTGAGGRGVDSLHGVDHALKLADQIARESACVVAITGPEDYVTDGHRSVRIMNGHPLMSRVTGTGCAVTAITGAFCAVEADRLMATIAALVAFGIAGELAAATHPRPGGFQVRLLDALDEVGPEQIRSLARVVCAA